MLIICFPCSDEDDDDDDDSEDDSSDDDDDDDDDDSSEEETDSSDSSSEDEKEDKEKKAKKRKISTDETPVPAKKSSKWTWWIYILNCITDSRMFETERFFFLLFRVKEHITRKGKEYILYGYLTWLCKSLLYKWK